MDQKTNVKTETLVLEDQIGKMLEVTGKDFLSRILVVQTGSYQIQKLLQSKTKCKPIK